MNHGTCIVRRNPNRRRKNTTATLTGCPRPQYWISAGECGWAATTWVLGFKEITAPTNVRTFIAAILPAVGFGNKIPILKPETPDRNEWLLAANFNSTIFDFVRAQKVQGQTLNLYIVEQLPVVPPDIYNGTRFGTKTAAEIVRDAVLELTYTAHDMSPFAAHLGYVDDAGEPRAPFQWGSRAPPPPVREAGRAVLSPLRCDRP